MAGKNEAIRTRNDIRRDEGMAQMDESIISVFKTDPDQPEMTRAMRDVISLAGVMKDLSTEAVFASPLEMLDRKSTRLNSSHVAISYAVFCLKKKIKKNKKYKNNT